MALVITTDVFCDGCGNWVHGVTGNRVRARPARETAATKGWVRRRGQDLCPSCAPKEKP